MRSGWRSCGSIRRAAPAGPAAALSANVVDPEAVRDLPPRDRVEWLIDREPRTVRLETPEPALAGLVLPLAPMIGCFGVAPPQGQAISTASSGRNGGNMDYRGFGRRLHGELPGVRAGRALLPRRLPRGAGRRRDRRHRHRDLLRGRGAADGREGRDDRLAARRDRGPHLHRRQRPPARPGAAARHDRDGGLADGRLRLDGRPGARTCSGRWCATRSATSSTRPTRWSAASRSSGCRKLDKGFQLVSAQATLSLSINILGSCATCADTPIRPT